MPSSTCLTSGKRRWPSRVGARRHQRALQRQGGAEGSIYRCPGCGGWHVTHLSSKLFTNEARAGRRVA